MPLISIAASANPRPPSDRCVFYNILGDFAKLTFLDPPLSGYDLCAVIPVTGSIVGRLVSCLKLADVLTSDDVFRDGNTDFVGVRWYDVMESKRGTMIITERGWVDMTSSIQSSIMSIVGGTEAYVGASGVLVAAPEWSQDGMTFRIRGNVCTAAL
jgi:hypothetical protein